MTELISNSPQVYQTKSENVRQNRKIFYSSYKLNHESIAQWYWRIKEIVLGCDFGTIAEFLLIDKFLCELNADEIQKFKYVDTWSVDQLVNVVYGQNQTIENNVSEGFAKSDMTSDDTLDIKLDINNDDTFVHSNIDSSDTENAKRLSDIKREIEEGKKKKNLKSLQINTRRNESKSIRIQPTLEIKGFAIDKENRHHCLDCGKTFAKKGSYIQHSRLHSRKNLSCTICNKVFLKLSNLKGHFKRHERQKRTDGKSFECHLCKYHFLALHGLRIHMNVKHVAGIKNEFQCQYCNEVFVNQAILEDHHRSEHRIHITHKCPHCSKEFDELNIMKEHLTNHSEAKPHMCEVCGNAFKTRKQLHMHMTRHTNERRFKCGECGLMLKSRSNYKNHMRQHTGERPFKCARCEKTFVQRANYLKHLRWHSGVKPHGCAYCEKRFPTAYDMKLHINSIHTGHKPFRCEWCDKSFAQPSTLRVHRLRVHKQTAPN